MLFRIKKSYKSLLTAQELKDFMIYLESKETGISFLKSRAYDVRYDNNRFTVRKRGATQNGPIFPLIRFKVTQGDYLQIDLDIKPSYLVILFCSIISGVLSMFILLNDKIKINGVYTELDFIERVFWFLFPIIIAIILCYFKTIKPTRDAEAWLIKKLKLTPTGASL